MSNASEFLDTLQQLFGKPEDMIRKMPTNDSPPVHVLFFYDRPSEGLLTSVTYGLSEGHHPDWRYAHPELVTMLATTDEAWGLATGYFAAQFRNEKSFRYCSFFSLDSPISGDSDMSAFVVGPPLLADRPFTYSLTDTVVALQGMYPVYPEEIEVAQRLGLQEFLSRIEEPFNTNRPPVV